MTGLPLLKPEGKANLDRLLHETVSSRSVPATFFGATNAVDEFYFACEGDKTFGQPAGGQVGPETSERITVGTIWLRRSAPTILHDQVRDFGT